MLQSALYHAQVTVMNRVKRSTEKDNFTIHHYSSPQTINNNLLINKKILPHLQKKYYLYKKNFNRKKHLSPLNSHNIITNNISWTDACPEYSEDAETAIQHLQMYLSRKYEKKISAQSY